MNRPILPICGLSKFCKVILNWKTRLRNPPQPPFGKGGQGGFLGDGVTSKSDSFGCGSAALGILFFISPYREQLIVLPGKDHLVIQVNPDRVAKTGLVSLG
jgi:hypothetical protein